MLIRIVWLYFPNADLGPVCETLLPFKFYLVCFLNGKVKAPWKLQGGITCPPPLHRNRVNRVHYDRPSQSLSYGHIYNDREVCLILEIDIFSSFNLPIVNFLI